jgi:hypothetical protein
MSQKWSYFKRSIPNNTGENVEDGIWYYQAVFYRRLELHTFGPLHSLKVYKITCYKSHFKIYICIIIVYDETKENIFKITIFWDVTV